MADETSTLELVVKERHCRILDFDRTNEDATEALLHLMHHSDGEKDDGSCNFIETLDLDSKRFVDMILEVISAADFYGIHLSTYKLVECTAKHPFVQYAIAIAAGKTHMAIKLSTRLAGRVYSKDDVTVPNGACQIMEAAASAYIGYLEEMLERNLKAWTLLLDHISYAGRIDDINHDGQDRCYTHHGDVDYHGYRTVLRETFEKKHRACMERRRTISYVE